MTPAAKLFSKAFGHDKSPLVWRVNDEDSICYAPQFTATFSGFRNSRAHRAPGFESEHALVRELLQLNQWRTHTPRTVPQEDLRPMHRIDELHLQHP